MYSIGPRRRYGASRIGRGGVVIGDVGRVLGVAARLAGAAGRARLDVMILLVVREPYEIVIVGYLKVGSYCYNGALKRYRRFYTLN